MANDTENSPVSSGQFVSFEKAAGIAFAVIFALVAWVWVSRVSTVDARFDKAQDKLDSIIISLAKIETQMANVTTTVNKTSGAATDNKMAIVSHTARLTHLEKSKP